MSDEVFLIMLYLLYKDSTNGVESTCHPLMGIICLEENPYKCRCTVGITLLPQRRTPSHLPFPITALDGAHGKEYRTRRHCALIMSNFLVQIQTAGCYKHSLVAVNWKNEELELSPE